MQELQLQFSQQLERLEDHHRHETETFQAQQEASLAHWQQQVKDREMLLDSQSQTAESNERKAQASIDKLSSQLNQARELLADKDVERRELLEQYKSLSDEAAGYDDRVWKE